MLLLTDKQLKNLPVYAKSGQLLGKVVGWEMDGDSQQVMTYQVSGGLAFKHLWQGKLLVNRQQVLSLSSEKMVVEDNVVKEETSMLAAVKNEAEPEISSSLAASVEKN